MSRGWDRPSSVPYANNARIGGEASAAVAEISGGVCHVDYRLGRRDTFDYHVTEDQLQMTFSFDGRFFLCMSKRVEKGSRTIFYAPLSLQDGILLV